MASDARYGDDLLNAETAPEPRKSGSGCLKGCLIVGVILAVLVVLGIFLAVKYGPVWLMGVAAQGINQAIDQSDLPAQEKDEVKVQVNRVADEFRAGRLSYPQLGTIFEKLAQSPLMTSFVTSVIDEKYLDRSGLPDAEKVESRQTLRRFVRGMVDGKIPKASIDDAMQHVADRQGNGEWKLRDAVTDDNLRAFFTSAKTSADTAQIPVETEEIDPSDEIKKVIDAAMAAERPQ